tara:strand:+ start:12184 stop:12615 length:432 start_codon:yes stop_codon:yes gene_type:complete
MGNKAKRAIRAKLKAKQNRLEKQNRNKNSIFEQYDDEEQQHSLTEPMRFFGYDTECSEDENPFEHLPSSRLICMVSQVIEEGDQSVSIDTGINFKVGDWFLSEKTGEHQHNIHGPFSTVEEAFEFGRKTLNVVSFRSQPSLEL